MPRPTALLLWLSTCALARGGDPAQIAIWPADAPVPGEDGFVCGPEAAQTRQYVGVADRIYVNVSRGALWPYMVANGTGAAVLVAPGGGYSHLNFDDEGTRVAARLNAMGVSALVLKYRVPARPQPAGQPMFAAQLMDAQRAMGVARSLAPSLGFNASMLGFMGFSAGGHLTAHISTNWRERLYARVDAADDLPCRPDFSLLLYPWILLRDNNPNATELQPDIVVNASHPPAFIAQNIDDTTAWPQGAMLYARTLLTSKAPPPTLHLYPRGGQGFGVCSEVNTDPEQAFNACCDWPAAAQRFLQQLGLAPGWPKQVTVCNSTAVYVTPVEPPPGALAV
jgi:acetyl esterase/lipase